MTIRVEKDPMGMGGRAWHLSAPSDLSSLPKEAAAHVDARARELFADVPGALERLAEQAPLPAMRRWLEGLRGARCTLEVYATKHAGQGARLRFHFAPHWAPSFRVDPGTPRVACPPLLERVHAVAAAVDTQFGCSGALVALDELPTVRELVAEQRVLGFDELRPALRKNSELGDLAGVLEVDGDWLCTNPAGEALWLGGEWAAGGPNDAKLRLEDVLADFFTALAEKRYYQPGG